LRTIDCPGEAAALTWIQEQFEQPFADLSVCVFEDTLIRLAPEEYWYFAKAHHLVMDGWGFALQMQRFLELYERLAETDVAGKHERTTYPSFVDHMRRQSGYRDSSRYMQSCDYWLARHQQPSTALFTPMNGQTAVTGSRPTHHWPKNSEPKEARRGLETLSVTVSPFIINNRPNGCDRCRVHQAQC
jgi:hypothetical protein